MDQKSISKKYQKSIDSHLKLVSPSTPDVLAELSLLEKLLPYAQTEASSASAESRERGGIARPGGTLVKKYGACSWCKATEDECVWRFNFDDKRNDRPVCIKCGLENVGRISKEHKGGEITVDSKKETYYVCKIESTKDSKCELCEKYDQEYILVKNHKCIKGCIKCAECFLMFSVF